MPPESLWFSKISFIKKTVEDTQTERVKTHYQQINF